MTSCAVPIGCPALTSPESSPSTWNIIHCLASPSTAYQDASKMAIILIGQSFTNDLTINRGKDGLSRSRYNIKTLMFVTASTGAKLTASPPIQCATWPSRDLVKRWHLILLSPCAEWPYFASAGTLA